MDIVHCAQMPWGESLVAQRGDTQGMAHKRLFEGDEAAPDNYMLVMSQEPKSYFSPRHRHPWDQIRFCLEGKIPIAKGLYIEGGEIGYFPESAHYGPQEGGDDRIVLLLQFGGASGQGFIGPDRLKAARLDMEQAGVFERGVFRVETPSGPHNRDAYEAVWDHVKGRPPAYVSPVYKTPIVMRPSALAWHRQDTPGVFRKQIGIFPHRGLDITGWQLEAGRSLAIPAIEALRFLFVTAGTGTANKRELKPWSAVRLLPGEEAEVTAATQMEWVEFSVGVIRQP